MSLHDGVLRSVSVARQRVAVGKKSTHGNLSGAHFRSDARTNRSNFGYQTEYFSPPVTVVIIEICDLSRENKSRMRTSHHLVNRLYVDVFVRRQGRIEVGPPFVEKPLSDNSKPRTPS